MSDLRGQLRADKIRYRTITRAGEAGLLIRFRDDNERDRGLRLLEEDFTELEAAVLENEAGESQLQAVIREEVLLEVRRLALQQNITTLRKRVNELGVAEPVIQQQGLDRVVVLYSHWMDRTIAFHWQIQT